MSHTWQQIRSLQNDATPVFDSDMLYALHSTVASDYNAIVAYNLIGMGFVGDALRGMPLLPWCRRYYMLIAPEPLFNRISNRWVCHPTCDQKEVDILKVVRHSCWGGGAPSSWLLLHDSSIPVCWEDVADTPECLSVVLSHNLRIATVRVQYWFPVNFLWAHPCHSSIPLLCFSVLPQILSYVPHFPLFYQHVYYLMDFESHSYILEVMHFYQASNGSLPPVKV
ncbi:hypothetical protein PR048_005534 [Dryococelus australis]|uniref:Uncharacterized protein n=1 Tax=Dryococelus australis TaxID=614101 RepID=A0ABQ9I8J3_9NEOP|nr:hypothetical protein PR048_005534 [Dryococelus australis]